MQVFGLSSATLEDYLTTERDLANRITRMPPSEFLLNRRETFTSTGDMKDEDGKDGDDDELFDDFVLLSPPDFEKYNTAESLNKEKKAKN